MPARSISWKTSFFAMVGGPSSKIFWNLLEILRHFDGKNTDEKIAAAHFHEMPTQTFLQEEATKILLESPGCIEFSMQFFDLWAMTGSSVWSNRGRSRPGCCHIRRPRSGSPSDGPSEQMGISPLLECFVLLNLG